MIKLKKHYKLLISLAALMFVLTACASYDKNNTLSPHEDIMEDSPMAIEPENQVKATYQKLDQSTAKQDLETNEAILLVDVRTPEEYAEKRIPNSLLLPDYELAELAPEQLPDKDALIYLYCRSGNRTRTAAKTLIDMGYTQVYDIGGIVDWKYETISD